MTERDAETLARAYFQTDFGTERILDMGRDRLLEAYADLVRDRDAWQKRAELAGFDVDSLHA